MAHSTIWSTKVDLYPYLMFFSSKCQIFYQDDPFMVSKASMQYLYDEQGKQYLDCISNVQHGKYTVHHV